MPIQNNWRVWCTTEAAYVNDPRLADQAAPTVCPNESGAIDANASAIRSREVVPGSADPTVNDDVDRGYEVGHKWTNSTSGREWVCIDNSDGAAIWQSVETVTFSFGRNGALAAGSYYRGPDGKTMSATLGYHAQYDGILTAFGYRRSDSDAVTFAVMADGASIYTLPSSATSGADNSISVAFSQGEVLSVMNQSGGNTTTDVFGWFSAKWRA